MTDTNVENSLLFRAARFNSVHHLNILFPNNFGAETTKVYYIGLRGDFMEVCRAVLLWFNPLNALNHNNNNNNNNAQNSQMFYYSYTEMFCARCSRHQCRTKSNIAGQNLQKFYNFFLILRTTANSAHIGQFCAKFCGCLLFNCRSGIEVKSYANCQKLSRLSSHLSVIVKLSYALCRRIGRRYWSQRTKLAQTPPITRQLTFLTLFDTRFNEPHAPSLFVLVMRCAVLTP